MYNKLLSEHNMSTMELGDRLVHVRSTVKHEKPEKDLFTQDDIVLIFSDIVRTSGPNTKQQ